MLQLQVLNSLFNQEQADLLNRLLPTITDTQKIWLSGYLAATLQSELQGGSPVTHGGIQGARAEITKEVTILYGSQTGNSKGLANKAAKTLGDNGFKLTVQSMSDFKPNQLKKIKNLLLVISTHGEGDPPDNALTFFEFLHSKRAPKLADLHFSVLALGDSSYEFFCKTGKDFDQRLEELGASRLYPRFDCDVDFEEPASEWIQGVFGSLNDAKGEEIIFESGVDSKVGVSAYSRSNPFHAEVLENINLNGRGSNKETRHLELSLEGSGLSFEPGDSLGVYPENDPNLVELILNELTWSSDEKVVVKQDETRTLYDALYSFYEITVLTKPLLEKIVKLSTNQGLSELLINKEELKAYIEGRDLLDFIRDYGVWGNSAQEFVSVLRKIPVRLYSIASSLAANPDEVHLTIGAVRYESNGRRRSGVCSILTAERLQVGDTLPVFIQHNENFKLPTNPEVPIIMIGPGTGIAPFRSFMQEREELGADGRSWLFFGDQHFVTDFLYQIEWQKWLDSGVLTRADIAFSRDQEEKIYVQNRMRENSKELYKWLEDGAYVYVCGDEKNMARDVHHALIDIIETEGGFSREQAEEYVSRLSQEKRYQRDVY